MKKDAYHHGNLRNELIKTGLKLLNEEGYQKFSLRNVAKSCNVSHTAPYRHFKNKDELVAAITVEAVGKFDEALKEAVKLYPDDWEEQLKEMGFRYVKFFVENPDYLHLLFLSDIRKYIVSNEEAVPQGNHPFHTFFNCITKLLAEKKIAQPDIHTAVMKNWGLVHGLAILISKREYPYDGDYLDLARRIIQTLEMK